MTPNSVNKDPNAARHFRGRNFMTPNVLQVGYVHAGKGRQYAYELSSGKFSGQKIWGLSVANLNGQRVDELSACHFSEQSARSALAGIASGAVEGGQNNAAR